MGKNNNNDFLFIRKKKITMFEQTRAFFSTTAALQSYLLKHNIQYTIDSALTQYTKRFS
jgi:hypothetical protein